MSEKLKRHASTTIAGILSPPLVCLDSDVASLESLLAKEVERGKEVDERLRALVRMLKDELDSCYIRSLDVAKTEPCLGWEAKTKAGEFRYPELTAHKRVSELYGRSTGIGHAREMLLRMLSPAPPSPAKHVCDHRCKGESGHHDWPSPDKVGEQGKYTGDDENWTGVHVPPAPPPADAGGGGPYRAEVSRNGMWGVRGVQLVMELREDADAVACGMNTAFSAGLASAPSPPQEIDAIANRADFLGYVVVELDAYTKLVEKAEASPPLSEDEVGKVTDLLGAVAKWFGELAECRGGGGGA